MFLILFLGYWVHAYEILISRYQQYCLGEDLTPNTLVVGEIQLKDSRSHGSFSFTVKDQEGSAIYSKSSVREDKFSFVTAEAGQHTVCISGNSQGTMVLQFDLLTGVAANDRSDLPQAKDLKQSEFRVNRIVESIKEMQKELTNIKERDEQMSYTNETINSRVVNYSVVTLILLVLLALAQTVYLKGFMKSKKMI